MSNIPLNEAEIPNSRLHPRQVYLPFRLGSLAKGGLNPSLERIRLKGKTGPSARPTKFPVHLDDFAGEGKRKIFLPVCAMPYGLFVFVSFSGLYWRLPIL